MSESSVQRGAYDADALKAFAELATIMLGSGSLNETLHRVAELAKQTIKGADDVSITLMDGDKARTVVFTGALVVSLDERQYDDGFGPCMDAAVSGETVIVDNRDPGTAYPDFSQAALRAGMPHTVSIGLPVAQRVVGGLNIYGSDQLPFGAVEIERGEAFAIYAGVAIANAALYSDTAELAEQMRAAMHSRSVIEQAKGVLMGRECCSSEEAFRLMVRASQNKNVKLRELAQTIVDSAGRLPERSRH